MDVKNLSTRLLLPAFALFSGSADRRSSRTFLAEEATAFERALYSAQCAVSLFMFKSRFSGDGSYACAKLVSESRVKLEEIRFLKTRERRNLVRVVGLFTPGLVVSV